MLKTVLVCLSLACFAVEIFGGLSCDHICKVDKLEMYGPVCGSDGNTYSTKCALKKAVCRSRKAVSIVYYGKCQYRGQDCINNIICHRDKVGICASDGNPYVNECAMRKHACMDQRAKVGVKLGTDCKRCPICKGGSKKKVCGSDHQTYKSLCELRAAACKKKEAIIVLMNGACEAKSDPRANAMDAKRDHATTEPPLVWGFKRDQAKTEPPLIWGFKSNQANSKSPENVRDFMEDEDARLRDENDDQEEDEEDNDAEEDDDQD